MDMMRLNSQVRQFDGFTPWKMVFGRTQKMPIGTACTPHFGDFMNPKGVKNDQNAPFLGVIRKIGQASITADLTAN